jgi:hypothetical protein
MANYTWHNLPKLEQSRFDNARGNAVLNLGLHQGERYFYDFEVCTPAEGWKQYDTDQDASYFGVWVQMESRWILTFAEGDVSLVQCPTVETFRAELANMAEFYGDPPPAFVCIDTNGQITNHYDQRPE